jgi:hypothetical protein
VIKALPCETLTILASAVFPDEVSMLAGQLGSARWGSDISSGSMRSFSSVRGIILSSFFGLKKYTAKKIRKKATVKTNIVIIQIICID